MQLSFWKPVAKTLLAAALAVGSQAATLTFSSPSPVSAGQSLSVTVGVELQAGESLTAYQMDILFPSFLEAESVEELGYFAANGIFFSPGFIDNHLLTVSFIASALSGLDEMVTTGPLFRINFSALGPGSGTVTADPLSVVLLDAQFLDLAFDIQSGNVEVAEAGAPVPEPSTLLLVFTAFGLLALKRR